MIKIILMCFRYNSSMELPGPSIIIDMYRMYEVALKITTKENIVVITDIEEDEVKVTHEIENLIKTNNLSYSIFSLIWHIKMYKIYYLYKNKTKLLEFLNEFLNGCDQLLFYYTGHGEKNFFILPCGEKLSNLIYKEIKESIYILDCCYPGVELPFVMNKDGYYKLNIQNFVSNNIIYICPTSYRFPTLALQEGSLFTKAINSFFLSDELTYYTLKKINENIEIYSSYSDLYLKYFWLSKSKLILNIDQNFIKVVR